MPEAEVAIGCLTLRPHRQLMEGGRTVPLGGKPLDILSVLALADGGVVTKDELMAAVWPGVIVEENAIQVHVAALRKALGREARRLVTVRGRGYLFDVQAPAANGATARTPSRSIAVLPFTNLTGDASKDYLADGIAEELICTLSRASGVKVAARTSSFAYRGRETDVRTIARELGVEAVIEGSLRAAGERLRVTAQIIDAQSGFHLWSQNYDRESGDLLTLQDEIAAAIASAFQANLGGRQRPTNDEEAYDLYLKARALTGRGGAVLLLRAIELHEQAIARDPLFSRAWAGLAETLVIAANIGAVSLDRRVKARKSADKAIDLDPELSQPCATIASVEAFSGRWLAAEERFRGAMALGDDPAVHTQIAWHLFGPCGQLRRALSASGRAVELAPSSALCRSARANIATLCGEFDLAASELEMALMLGAAEDEGLVRIVRSRLALQAGDFAVAGEQFAVIQPPPIVAAGGADAIRLVYRALAGNADAAAASAALVKVFEAIDADDAIWRHPAAASPFMTWQVMLGARDNAFAVADRLVEAWRRTGHLATLSLIQMWQPCMQPFRQDPRFQTLVERLGMVEYWKVHGPPDGCERDGGKLVWR